jgi:hypothetical protein
MEKNKKIWKHGFHILETKIWCTHQNKHRKGVVFVVAQK